MSLVTYMFYSIFTFVDVILIMYFSFQLNIFYHIYYVLYIYIYMILYIMYYYVLYCYTISKFYNLNSYSYIPNFAKNNYYSNLNFPRISSHIIWESEDNIYLFCKSETYLIDAIWKTFQGMCYNVTPDGTVKYFWKVKNCKKICRLSTMRTRFPWKFF